MTFWLNPAVSAASVEHIEPGRASPWDTCYLGVWWLPGLCSVDVETSQGIDVAKGTAIDGASLRFTGVDPAPVTIRVTTWTEQQYNDLALVLLQVDPRKRKTLPPPLQVRHPKTALAGVLEIAVKKVIWFADGPSPQIKVTTIEAIQYLKPRPVAPAGTLNLPTVAPTQTPGAPSSSAAKRGP